MLCKVQYSTKSLHLQEQFCTSGHPFSPIVWDPVIRASFWGAVLLVRALKLIFWWFHPGNISDTCATIPTSYVGSML
jgi:hypothetical protein